MDVKRTGDRPVPAGLGFIETHDLLASGEPYLRGGALHNADRSFNYRPSLKLAVEDALRDSIHQIKHDRQPQTILGAFGRAWEIATAQLTPWDTNRPTTRVDDEAVTRAALDCIAGANMAANLLDVYESDILPRQIPLFESLVDSHLNAWHETGDISKIKALVTQLCIRRARWQPKEMFGTAFSDIFARCFNSNLHLVLPQTFQQAFVSLVQSTIGAGDRSELFAQLHTLGLLERFECLISSVICDVIERQIAQTCPGRWNTPVLPELRSWLGNNVVPWLHATQANGGGSASSSPGSDGVADRFDLHLCKTLCDLRTTEIFDMIIDYPDSVPALLDLKECMQRIDQRANLVATLRKLNKRRLLHPGADTKDILSQYVATIKCLRVVDPPSVLLFKVADPIRRYLRHRPDTIRTIVAGLVGEGSDLIDDSDPTVPMHAMAEDFSDPNWEPEPLDAGPNFRANKPSDVISTLVSIYDSKDLFVKELQVLLAERLLSISDGNYEREIRNIEVLKLRFGENALHVCEIMLKDMTDSKRMDQRIQQDAASVLHSSIVSKHFWPSLNASNVKMPERLQKILDGYEKAYIQQKPDMRLLWISQLGTVSLHIELQDRTVDVKATTFEAAVIELFSDKAIWTLDDLVEALGSDVAAVRKALTRWLDMRIVKEDKPHQYRLLEVEEEASAPMTHDAPQNLSVVAGPQQQQTEQIRVFWRFIQGMLTNVGPMPVDRIQSMLKLAPGYDRNVDQLLAFLNSARREGLVDVKDGVWKLNK